MPVAEAYMQLAADVAVAPNTAGLSDADRGHAWAMTQQVTGHFMTMQEELVAYFTSLDADHYIAAERDIQFAMQIADRLVRVMRYYHADAPETKALEGRLADMESSIEAYERELMTAAAL